MCENSLLIFGLCSFDCHYLNFKKLAVLVCGIYLLYMCIKFSQHTSLSAKHQGKNLPTHSFSYC